MPELLWILLWILSGVLGAGIAWRWIICDFGGEVDLFDLIMLLLGFVVGALLGPIMLSFVTACFVLGKLNDIKRPLFTIKCRRGG